MMYYGEHFPVLIWLGAAIGMIAFWGLVLFLGALAFRALTSGNHTHAADDADDARARPSPADPRLILAARFARGEIDEDEYRHRLAALGGTPVPPESGREHPRSDQQRVPRGS